MSANDSAERGRRIGQAKCDFFTPCGRLLRRGLSPMKTAVRGSLQSHRRESSCEIDSHRRAYAASSTISSFADWVTAAALDDAGIPFIAACALTIP